MDDYTRRIMNSNASVSPQGINREVLFHIGRTIDGGADLPANFDIYVTLVATLVQRYSAQLNMSGIPGKKPIGKSGTSPISLFSGTVVTRTVITISTQK